MAQEDKITYIEDEGTKEASKRVEKLRKILRRCKKERQEYLEGWQRARADHQNYIKQKDQDMTDFRKFACTSIVLQILPILDNLTLASESIPKDAKDDSWAKGIEQVRKHFASVLRENGVEAISAKAGDKFDPLREEAVEEVAGEGESGTIAEVLREGYMLNGKVIRPARVKVIK